MIFLLYQCLIINFHLLAITPSCRFFGLFGIYFSLRYLSLSDATVLTFLAPLCTAGVGALVLGEKIGWRQVVAGRAYSPVLSSLYLFDCDHT